MRFSSNSLAAAMAAALLLPACGGGGGDSSAGSLNLAITDAPVDDASDVVIEVRGLEVHANGGTTRIDFDAPRAIHLLTLTDGASQPLLDGYRLPAGHYQWIRLLVNTDGEGDSYVVTNSGTYEITIPSGARTGLKLVRGFDVPAGGSADFTIDFDLRKSLVDTNGSEYILKPVLRLVDNTAVGAVAGDVDLAAYGCDTAGNAVYVFTGHDATPTGLNTAEPGSPLLIAPLRDADSAPHYRAAFLPAGDYTVALSCEADTDTAEGAEAILFQAHYNVTVMADQTTRQDFPAP